MIYIIILILVCEGYGFMQVFCGDVNFINEMLGFHQKFKQFHISLQRLFYNCRRFAPLHDANTMLLYHNKDSPHIVLRFGRDLVPLSSQSYYRDEFAFGPSLELVTGPVQIYIGGHDHTYGKFPSFVGNCRKIYAKCH